MCFRGLLRGVLGLASLELEAKGARNARRERRTDSVALARVLEGLAAILMFPRLTEQNQEVNEETIAELVVGVQASKL